MGKTRATKPTLAQKRLLRHQNRHSGSAIKKNINN